MKDSRVQLRLTGDFEVTIGSHPTSQVILPGLEPVHARLKRTGDRLFLKALHTDGGTTSINRVPIKPNRWIEVTRYDEIVIAGTVLSLSLIHI